MRVNSLYISKREFTLFFYYNSNFFLCTVSKKLNSYDKYFLFKSKPFTFSFWISYYIIWQKSVFPSSSSSSRKCHLRFDHLTTQHESKMKATVYNLAFPTILIYQTSTLKHNYQMGPLPHLSRFFFNSSSINDRYFT